MTIAVGFRFDQGILLCADTEVSKGISKASSSKIYPIDFGEGILCFAIAGSVSNARMTIESIRDRLAIEPDYFYLRVKNLIREELVKTYSNHVYPTPRPDLSSFDLLVAYWTPPNNLLFWLTEDNAIREADGYECIGIGSYLGNYLASAVYEPTIGREQVVALAIEILRDAKEHISGCGKRSDFFLLNQDGQIGHVQGWDITTQENYGRRFNLGIRDLWGKVCNSELSDNDIQSEIDKLSSLLWDIRGERTTLLREYRRLVDKFAEEFIKKKTAGEL